MIYNFTIKKSKKRDAEHDLDFYLTAANEKDLYRRIISQYGVQPQEVTINKVIDEDSIDINIKKKVAVAPKDAVTDKPKKSRRKK